MANSRQLWRPEFLDALRLFAQVSEALARQGFPRPVLVGGAAAEYYSASALATGDFDVCSPVQPELEGEMQRHGFVRPSGAGKLTRGWIHPELQLGFEVVARVPMDGSVDQDHILLVDGLAPNAAFAIISVEDLIADRLGQYASGSAREMLGQARQLFELHPDADRDYLEKRIRQETAGDYGIEILEG